jgi:iron-sulfur cluster assembly protein
MSIIANRYLTACSLYSLTVPNIDFNVRFGYFESGQPVLDLTVKHAREEGEAMITLTPEAIAKVKSILDERKEEMGLRIAVVGGGCSGFQYQMTLDKEPRTDDEILDMEGLKVYVDTRSLMYLNGTKVDYVDGQNGSGFKFDNPNAKASCGCGETFEA